MTRRQDDKMNYGLKKMNEMDYGLKEMNEMDCGLKKINDTMAKRRVGVRLSDDVMMELECYEINNKTERFFLLKN